MSPSAICFSTLSSATGPSSIHTPTIIIGLAGRSIRSHVVSTDDMRSLWLISRPPSCPHHNAFLWGPKAVQNVIRKLNLGDSAINLITMSEEPYRDELLRELDRSALLRARTLEDDGFSERRAALRAWQASRLARTHRDLLES